MVFSPTNPIRLKARQIARSGTQPPIHQSRAAPLSSPSGAAKRGTFVGVAIRIVQSKFDKNTGDEPRQTTGSRAMAMDRNLRTTAFGRVRLRAYKIVNLDYFQRFVLTVITANTVTMAMDSYGKSQSYYDKLALCETVFTSVFMLEFVLKHVALGVVKYWSNPWNVIDGAVVVSGTVELIVGTGARGIATLRMLRVLRIFAGLKGLRRYRAFRQVFAAVINGVRRIVSYSSPCSRFSECNCSVEFTATRRRPRGPSSTRSGKPS
jgi:hypothetical protein